jgi:hypothetical protein
MKHKQLLLTFFFLACFQTSAQSTPVEQYLKACRDGDSDTALCCLKNNNTRSLQLTSQTDLHGLTGLMLAASMGHDKTVKAILRFHQEHEILMRDNSRRYTARAWAEYHNQEMCAILLPEENYLRN